MFLLRRYSLFVPRPLRITNQWIHTTPHFYLPLYRTPNDPISILHQETKYSSKFNFTPKPDPESLLSEEQRLILELSLKGESLFFTGSAGTGKSFLLRQIISSLRRTLGPDQVAVTASTGLASINIGGETLHAFAGVGLGKQHANILIAKSLHRRNIERWRKTKVLIIDEISMVEAGWFDVLSEIGKVIRGSREPFGGIQLIVSGDFFQLPPVPETSHLDAGIPVRFAFQARDWNRAVPNRFRLTKVFRQHQPELIEMLEDMRCGKLTPASEHLLYRLSRPVEYPDGIKPVEIYPRRLLADAANLRQMECLPRPSITYRAEDRFGWDILRRRITPELGERLLERRAMHTIELRVGAQIMFIRNIPELKIANGSLGKIVDFLTPEEARNSSDVHLIPMTPTYELDNNPYTNEATNSHAASYIIKLGDRSMGSSVSGSLGVRQSARDPEFPWPTIQTEGLKWPLAQLDNNVKVLVTPALFSHENVIGRTEACRVQVPLILAWALTVHKAQGQTLSRVKVNLAGTFAPGQVYVGISRCTSLEGLEVLNFSPRVMFAHPHVIEWDKSVMAASSWTSKR